MSDHIRISADEAMARGYRFIRVGYDHAENKRIIGEIRLMALNACFRHYMAKAVEEGRVR
jgi:hypothetical protein